MRTIKVFIASSEELKQERLELAGMIQELNDCLESYDIRINPIKWEYLDASMNEERKQTEYNNALRECDICLVLFWTKFGDFTAEELNIAYEGLKAGENPRKLYVYFKETSAEATPDLKDFKNQFTTNYGPFYCKFENVETMRLNFLLQIEQYLVSLLDQDVMVKVNGDFVEFYGRKVIDLRNVPFDNNPDYNRLLDDLQNFEQNNPAIKAHQTTASDDAIEILSSQNNKDYDESLLKTMRVFIASSEDLKIERLEFVDMIQHLNYCLESRNIRINPVRWESLDEERRQTEYNKALRECELCLVMYWTELGNYTEEELNTAYEGLKKGKNPRKLYIYFKETPAELSSELTDFKGQFTTKYGHFYCRFENVDTMRLNFLLQFEQYQSSRAGDEMVKVKNSQVEFCGQKLADLRNVPFAGKNPDYKRLQDDLLKIEQEIITFETIQISTPNDAIAALLLQKRMDREKLTKELEEMETSLMETAKQIVSLSYTASSARLQKAIELFEKGDNKGANAVLNFDEIKADMQMNAQRIDQARDIEKKSIESLKKNIEECKLKVKTLQTEKSKGWLQMCIDIYEDVIFNATGRIADEELAGLRFDYAVLLQKNNLLEKSAQLYEQNIEFYRNLADAHLPGIARNVGNLAIIYCGQKKYNQAENGYNEAISIYKNLAENTTDFYLPDVALNVGNLAVMHEVQEKYEQAEKEYNEAIIIYKELAEKTPEAYLPDVARNTGNLAILHDHCHKYEQAEEEYNKAISIFRDFAKKASADYLPDVALYVGNLAIIHDNLDKYEQAENEFYEAITTYRYLIEKVSASFLPDLARNVRNIAYLYYSHNEFAKANSYYEEALTIYTELAKKDRNYYSKVEICQNKLSCINMGLKKIQTVPTFDEVTDDVPVNSQCDDSERSPKSKDSLIDKVKSIFGQIWK